MKSFIKEGSNTAAIIGPVRFSYANVFEPKSINNGDPKYSVSLIINKDDTHTLNIIKSCIHAALEEGKSSKFGGKIPPVYKNPLRDGDMERPDHEEYENAYFINCNSSKAPQVVKKEDGKAVPIDEDEFYSGCYGFASVNFYAFNSNGNKGIACGLNNLLKTDDGDRLSGGGSTAANDFGLEESNDFM